MEATSIRRIAGVFRQENDFLIVGHVRPDGDSISACLLTRGILRRLGRRATVVVEEAQVDPRLSFLEGFDRIRPLDRLADRERTFQWAVILDCPTPDRIGRVVDLLPPTGRIVNIDHHESNEFFGVLNEVRPDVSSTCEILYDLVEELGIPWDLGLARPLYAGIVFDTGRFRFANTTPRSLEIAARMIEVGVRPERVAYRLFFQRSRDDLQRIAEALGSIRYHLDGRVASLAVDGDRFGQSEEGWRSLDGIVDAAMSVEGVEVGLYLKRFEPGSYRVSLRSGARVNVSDVACAFGGGGHARAAGCTVPGDRDQVERRLLERIRPQLEREEPGGPDGSAPEAPRRTPSGG